LGKKYVEPPEGAQPLQGAEEQHEWTLKDDMLALYLYKVEQEKKINLAQKDIKELALAFGINVKSMQARIENYKHLDGKGGLANVSEQTQQVWDAYWDLSAETLMEKLTERK
jgi:hypothetical protein